MSIELHHGDCIDILSSIKSQSVDAVITDPPYPMIKRAYGMLTVEQWWTLMMIVCKETRRILKPTGSAVFILQPNSEHVGQMRGWLWEFMAWVCRDWNMVQDAYWWNICAMPTVHTQLKNGLMRPSVKHCVWAGISECYRNQQSVLWSETEGNIAQRAHARMVRDYAPSGHSNNRKQCSNTATTRGGVTPFNVLPIPATSQRSAGANGHGAGTPLKLADWWTRYICPPGGTVCDPFMGSGTMGIAAIQNNCNFVGIEKFPEPGREINDKDNPDYFGIAQSRVEKAQTELVQVDMFQTFK